jgi:hypothetical protein
MESKKRMKSLKVGALPKKNDYFYKPVDGRLPQTKSTAFIGASGSGKTNLMITLLKDKRFFKDYYKVYIFSPNYYNDALWESNISIPVKYVSTKWDEVKFRSIMDRQLEIKEKLLEKHGNLKKFKPALVILDDLVGATGMMNRNTIGFLEKTFTKNRHLNLRIWVSVQYFRSISKIIRENIDEWVLFGNDSDIERKEMMKELGGSKFESLFQKATEEPYSFMFYTKHGDKDKNFRKEFEKFMTLHENGDISIQPLILPPTAPRNDDKVDVVLLNPKPPKKKNRFKKPKTLLDRATLRFREPLIIYESSSSESSSDYEDDDSDYD